MVMLWLTVSMLTTRQDKEGAFSLGLNCWTFRESPVC